MKKKLIATATALGLVASLATTTAFAANFSDTKGHWAESAINRWSSYGVVEGTSPDTFNPNSNMTRAEAAQVFVNLLDLTGSANLGVYTDVNTDAWYADALSACVANGILNGMGNGTMNPNGTISREQFFVMFARALGIPEETSLNQNFADRDSISSWARGAVYALINRGYVNGVSSTSVAPLSNINRASVMSLLDQTIVSYVTQDGSVTVNGNGVVLVLADKVTLNGSGNVLVAVANAGTSIDVSGMTGSVEVMALENNVAVSGASAGTTVMAAAGVSGTTVNGTAVSAGGTVTVPKAEETTPSGGSSGGISGGGGTATPTPDVPDEPDVPDVPEEPDESVEPEEPDESVEPEEPDESVEPEEPDESVEPEEPDESVEPEEPDESVEPEEPDESVELPGGIIEYPGGSIEFPDGSHEMEDGNWELPDGTIVNGNGEVVEEA